MAPPTTSHRSKENFVQWTEPLQRVQKDVNDTGVASTSRARKQIDATRDKSAIQALVQSCTATESNTGLWSEPESELRIEKEAPVSTRAHRAPSTSQSANPQKFVPPRPTSLWTPTRHPQTSYVSPRDHASDARKSGGGRVIQRQQLQSEHTLHSQAAGAEHDGSATATTQRPPSKCTSVI